ncbi:MAG: SHOCT domain-containing protein [Paenarthrobacter ureafaciens]|uniref:SHOCT domain-containing protein n=1 Tax=Paenarthrobacter ureafaciens TaxID=37931 RepID=UPI001AC7F8BE|nr:SHOCT domain-containing protein [Paenarthrobacter ureafaciens]MBN9131695.1 SHOCT domain-containing protein [Paenarthrobacter ureafaciens]
MTWGYGQGMMWMWLWVPLLLVGVAILVLLAVKVFGGHGPAGPQMPGGIPPTGRSTARRILDERFARGELTADQYREHLKVLGEGP